MLTCKQNTTINANLTEKLKEIRTAFQLTYVEQ